MSKFKYLVIRKTYDGTKVLAAAETYRDAAEAAGELLKYGYQHIGVMDLKQGLVEIDAQSYPLPPDKWEWWKQNWKSQIARSAFSATRRMMKRGWK
jgi:hypothetical protein